MPFHFDFDLSNKIIRCRFDGLITDETLKDFYATASNYGALNPSFIGILDTSGVTVVNLTSKTIRELAMKAPAFPDPDIPRIIIAGSTELFGLARMFDLHGSATRPNLHVVRTEREAFAILHITDARFVGGPPGTDSSSPKELGD
jgi:hypothetical protein